MNRQQGVFLSFLVILIAYIIFMNATFEVSSTGMAYKVPEEKKGNIYNFLLLADNYGGKFSIVVGDNSREYEVELAEQISELMGIRVIGEDGVKFRENLILIGNTATNGVLDGMLKEGYDKAAIVNSGKNLYVIVNDKGQAEMALSIISRYRDNKERLAPEKIEFNGSSNLYFYVLAVLLIIPLFLAGIEIERKKGIAKARESKREHKVEVLKDYIQKYSAEGYSDTRIKQWLMNYGYKADVVDDAVKEVGDARADISS